MEENNKNKTIMWKLNQKYTLKFTVFIDFPCYEKMPRENKLNVKLQIDLHCYEKLPEENEFHHTKNDKNGRQFICDIKKTQNENIIFLYLCFDNS